MWGWGLVRGPIRDEEWLCLAQEAGLQMSFSVGEAPQVGMGVPEVQANPSLSGFMPGRRVGPEPAALLQFWVIWMANPGYRISTICFSSMTVLCNSMLIIRL